MYVILHARLTLEVGTYLLLGRIIDVQFICELLQMSSPAARRCVALIRACIYLFISTSDTNPVQFPHIFTMISV